MSEPLRLADLTNVSTAIRLLLAGGQPKPVAVEKARRFMACARALADAGLADDAQAVAFFVPGRIEVLGKHTDYAGGRSIIAAAERGICLVAVPRDKPKYRAIALDVDGECEFDISPDLQPRVGHWSNYPMTVLRRGTRNFPGPLRGATVAYSSDLPIAAGMSSSSTVMVANFLAVAAINGLAGREEYRREIHGAEDLAGYLGTIENGQSFGTLAGDKGVGTFGGSEDHVAMLCSQPGRLAQYAYCPVRRERRIDLPADYTFAIASSGVVSEKTGEAMAKYNRASALARQVVAVWNEATGRCAPHLAAALGSDDLADAADRMRKALLDQPVDGEFPSSQLCARFEHFLTENEQLLPAAGDALGGGSAALGAFGRLVDRSQQIADDLLGNQVPETVFLARSARDLGAAAASGFGAGFGGSVWALVRREEAETFLKHWSARYAAAFPDPAARATCLLTGAGCAAFQLGGQP